MYIYIFHTPIEYCWHLLLSIWYLLPVLNSQAAKAPKIPGIHQFCSCSCQGFHLGSIALVCQARAEGQKPGFIARICNRHKCWRWLRIPDVECVWTKTVMTSFIIPILYPVQQHLFQLFVDFWRCQGLSCWALLFRGLAVRFFNRFRDNTGRTLQILRHAKRAKFTAWIIQVWENYISLSCECMMCFCQSMHVDLALVLFLPSVCAEIRSTSKPLNHRGNAVDCRQSYIDQTWDLCKELQSGNSIPTHHYVSVILLHVVTMHISYMNTIWIRM